MTPSSDVLGGVFVGFVAFWQCSGRLFIKRRVVCVVVFAVKAFAGLVQGFCEALVVHQLTLAQETDDILDVGVVGKTQDIVVGGARLLLGCQIFIEVGDGIALDCQVLGIKGHTCCADGVDTRGMIHEIRSEGAFVDLLFREIARQLVHDGRDHFHVCKLFRADVRECADDLLIGHAVSLIEIAQGCAKLTVGATKMQLMMIKYRENK